MVCEYLRAQKDQNIFYIGARVFCLNFRPTVLKFCYHMDHQDHHLYILIVSIIRATFDVQNICEVTEEPPGNFCTQCVFVEGSKAKGCCIRLEEMGKESKA